LSNCPPFAPEHPLLWYDYFVIERTQMWDEIADMPGEIFDISDEDREEMAKEFDKPVEEYNVYWNTDREEFEVVA